MVRTMCVAVALAAAYATPFVAAQSVPSGELRIGVVFSSKDAEVRFDDTAHRPAAAHVRLIAIHPEGPWRGGAGQMARLVFEHQVAALIGAADASNAHSAAQIATRARIPFVTTSADESLTAAHDPWIFQAAPSDRAQAGALLAFVAGTFAAEAVDVVVPTGRDGRERLSAIRRALADHGTPLGTVTHYDPAEGSADRVKGTNRLLMLWLDPKPALAYLDGVGGGGPGRILASTRLDNPEFLGQSTTATDGVLLPRLRVGEAEGAVALTTALEHDIVAVVVAAAGRAESVDPTLVRNAIQAGEERCGMTGCFSFDKEGRRRGAIPIGVVRNGRLRVLRPIKASANYGESTSNRTSPALPDGGSTPR